MRVYKIEDLRETSKEDLKIKLDIVKTSNILTDEEKTENIRLITGVLNPNTATDEVYKMIEDGRADPVKMD